jgi:hypothetical protein
MPPKTARGPRIDSSKVRALVAPPTRGMIKLVVSTERDRASSTIKAPSINGEMMAAARELEYTMIHGKRPVRRFPAGVKGRTS